MCLGAQRQGCDAAGGLSRQWHLYLQWLAAKTRQTWRLPTEAEWEYAARGGLNARYPWGDEGPEGRANCNFCGDAFGGNQTAPVGRYAANAYGLHDMAGNAWEWVQDQVREGHESRVLRGGSWRNFTRNLRAAHRYYSPPDVRYDDFIGFRVCRVAPIEKPTTGAVDAGPPAR